MSNYIAMIGKKGDDVNLGYYGEKVVLLAQCLGLNTCWVAMSFSKQPDQYQVLPDEKLVCVVPSPNKSPPYKNPSGIIK